jgi:preprotein translocase subunit SecG
MTFFLYLTFILFLIVCTFLMLLILIQKGRGGGLAGAFGGGGGNTAFGSKTGDVLTWATSIVFGIFLVLAIALNLLANNYNTAKTGTNTNAATPATPGGPTAPIKGGNTSIPQVPPGSTDPGVLPNGPTTSK